MGLKQSTIATAFVLAVTPANADLANWKDAPELGNSDADNCITVNSDYSFSGVDGSLREDFLVRMVEEGMGDYYDHMQQIFRGTPQYDICLEETDPGVLGHYNGNGQVPVITLNEDIYRYQYEVLFDRRGDIKFGQMILSHEQEHAAIDMNDAGFDFDPSLSVSANLLALAQEEMVATIAEKEMALALGLHVDLESIEPEIVTEQWFEGRGVTYACNIIEAQLQVSGTLTGASIDIDRDIDPAIALDHWYDWQDRINSIFNDEVFLEKMQLDALSALHSVYTNPSLCIKDKAGEYNLTKEQQSALRDSTYLAPELAQ